MRATALIALASLGLLQQAAQCDPFSPIPATVAQTNNRTQLFLPLVPGVDAWRITSSTNLNLGFATDAEGSVSKYLWSKPSSQLPFEFFRVDAEWMDAESVYAANLLNRITYGPTPDEVERIQAIGPEAYLTEQLQPELIQETLDIDVVKQGTDWQYITVTGPATSSTIYIYLTKVGDAIIDDLKLVAGPVAEAGVNLIRNGDFESPLSTGWTVSPNLADSVITSTSVHSGSGALHIVSSSPGDTRETSIYQSVSGVRQNNTYTLSYWYKPSTNWPSGLIVRLSGNGIISSPENLATKLETGAASIEDLRAWHTLHAVRSKKQLLEVMLQFLDNHFVTQHRKSREYLDQYYSSTLINPMATVFEYKELQRWRAALLKPDCTFLDLLKISTESAAMIIYLDTVNSKGNGSNIANENFARELLELFTFGVDNGYDQNDITITSRAWTGWSVNIVDSDQEFNPFAPRTTNVRPGTPNNGSITNLNGVWTFNFKSQNHFTGAKTIFPGKVIPERFGPPWAGNSYQLSLPARSGTNGIRDGYDVIAHLANQPFTSEFISVKLCRLLIHEDFNIGYDFTSPDLSVEGKLVLECMRTWDNSTPKGQIRPVLETILKSDLFKKQTSLSHKIKTPFEFCVSAVRALRANVDGNLTAESDGFSLYSPMDRMGRMRLFDREEPDGYPETGSSWISAGTLAERLRFVQSLLVAPGQSGKSDAGEGNKTDPVKLLKAKLPQNDWKNVSAIADYFLKILYPGEGRANLAGYKEMAEQYLNTADDGSTNSPFATLVDTSTLYDTRVRGMVAMLMILPRFQEQ